jgi:ethanolamine utilization protein EutP (predicted NTPase)
MGIRDTRMIARAIEQRYPISPEFRSILVKRLINIVASKDAKNREAIAAARALLAAEAQNQADEHKVVDVSLSARNVELDRIAADLGIEPHLIVDGTAAGSGTDRSVEGDPADE